MSANIEIACDREEWLETRYSSIGGSEAASVLDVDPYRSAHQLWCEKTRRIEPKPATWRMNLGIRMESVIRDMAVEQTGYELESSAPYTIHRHRDYPWLTASLDAKILPIDERGPGVMQIKNVHGRLAHLWEDGQIPLHVQVQVQHEMFVSDLMWGLVVAFVGGDELLIRPVERNMRFISAMFEKEREFWELVENDTPPPVDGSESCRESLRILHPFGDPNENSVELPEEFDGMDKRLAEINKQLDALEDEKTLIKNRITAALGDATYGILPGGGRWRRKWIRKQIPAKEAYVSEYPDLRRIK